MADHGQALKQGTLLHEFRIEKILGEGGFGITYLAFDEHLEKYVAIKEYLPSDFAIRADDKTVIPRTAKNRDDFNWGLKAFLDEARVLARFDHPNIVRVSRFFQVNGTAYIVMEYIKGNTLSDKIKELEKLTEEEVLFLLRPLIDGLKQVHRENFYHRDIKPDNIILRENGSPVLIDFGAARQAIGSKSQSLASIVTPGYAPIEQYSSKGQLGAWTDIYALAAVSYTCLTGGRPDDASDRVVEDDVIPAVQAAITQGNPEFLAAIDRGLTIFAQERPQMLDEWWKQLTQIQQIDVPKEPESKVIPSPAKKTYLKRTLIIFGISAMCIVAYGINQYKQIYQGGGESKIDSEINWTEQVEELNQSAVENEQLAAAEKDFNNAIDLFYWQNQLDTVLPLLQKADEAGHSLALAEIAKAYSDGLIVKRDLTQAAKLVVESRDNLARQADKEVAHAQYLIGYFYESGIIGTEKNDFKALHWYQKAADNGYAIAQTNLGMMYEKGEGVEKNNAIALNWYRKAAEKGYSKAQTYLGMMYENEESDVRNDAKAVSWYQKAAKQGDAAAQFYLGMMYIDGRGVDEDYSLAFSWFLKAAEQGEPVAQAVLGDMYANGLGATQDTTESLRWYLKAAEQGNANAQTSLGAVYENGDAVPEDVNEALSWYMKAAEQGDIDAQTSLGRMYENLEDETEAFSWYLKAAEQGNANAQTSLGRMYESGDGTVEDATEAFSWYMKAAEQGEASAQTNLGDMYVTGRGGVAGDYTEAVIWYRKAAVQGYADAQFDLGVMYIMGHGVSEDYAEAANWYRKAAEQGHAVAQYELAEMYRNGDGILQNVTEALKWYRKAAEQGSADAERQLNNWGY